MKIGTTMYLESQPANESEFQEATAPGIESSEEDEEQKQPAEDQTQP